MQALPAGMALVRSPLLQAAALSALQGLFVGLIACKPAKTTFKSLLKSLLDAGKSPVRGIVRFSAPPLIRQPQYCCCLYHNPTWHYGRHSTICHSWWRKSLARNLAEYRLDLHGLQGTGKPAQLSVAQCIAVLCQSAGAKQTSSTVTTLLQTLQVLPSHRQDSLSRGPVVRSVDLPY